jgi:hypothetical protein
MIKLNVPTLVAKDLFETCISRIRDAGLRQRMIGITEDIVEASEEFSLLASQTRLHEVEHLAVVGGTVSTDEMEAVYTQRMAKKGAPGRDAYDELFNSAPQGKCPLCGQRTVATLDHHLPKAHYPALAVVPLNLVPACTDCNKAKLASIPAEASHEALHPYFDDVQSHRWLYASVVVANPPALRFEVHPPAAWDAVLSIRVARHFRTLGLASLYAAEAADELLNIRHQLHALHAAGGSDLVRLEMEDRAESCGRVRINSWRIATFEAFADSDWFCDGGFN